ncbi:TPA: tail assembly chaperone [Staphylococcus aureus]|uniref:tail assembly chaperone n=1 Tax=Staphylococcus aureus TaxID=1280 RepID=UPI000628A98C|nr:tail assembly chaperone [Staphylococcus aureus]MBE7602169.1 tail assembly chaperone [Staphylococcus aureus]MCE3311397.1 tail assembly chaperone [Staphylococcus aureus]MCE3336921.1 tail assembly chaperone [Staphylococcus aureus]QMI54239.1 tail assembly chaperone [Staphylococcus aureus]QZA64176.1 tail assembly chaperone [Staphylococcus aureus]
MVTVKNGKHELELKFGLCQLKSIDKELGLNVEKVNLGEGLSMLIPKLESGNVIGLAKIVSAATLGQKGRPKTDEELEEVLINARDEYGSFKKFGQAIIDVLGEQSLTLDLVQDHLKDDEAETVTEE